MPLKRTTRGLVVAASCYGLVLFAWPSVPPVAWSENVSRSNVVKTAGVTPVASASPRIMARPSPVTSVRAVALPKAKPTKHAASPLPSSVPSLPPSVAALGLSSPVAVSPSSTASVIPSLSPIVREAYRIETGVETISGQLQGVGRTVGQATQLITQEKGLSFVYESSDMGWFVTEIAGVKQDPRKGYYWLLYVNGQLANKGADKVILQAGDAFTWRYEKT